MTRPVALKYSSGLQLLWLLPLSLFICTEDSVILAVSQRVSSDAIDQSLQRSFDWSSSPISRISHAHTTCLTLGQQPRCLEAPPPIGLKSKCSFRQIFSVKS